MNREAANQIERDNLEEQVERENLEEQVRVLSQRVEELENELEETYRSITELTNEIEGEREKFRRLEYGLRQEYCFYTLDLNRQLVYVSPSAKNVLGYDCKEQMSMMPGVLTSHPINDKRDEVWQALLMGESQPGTEWEIVDAEGNIRRIECSDFPVFDSLGEVVCVEGLVRDITARKRRELELLRARDAAVAADRTKSNFLSHMSHELRTPLNGVLGYVQLLLRDQNITLEQVDYLTAIESCGHHLLTLINRVLDYSKIENFGVDLQLEPCRLRSLLRDIQHMLQHRARQKQIELYWEYPDNLPDGVILDETKFKQVLLNLLSNAIKFTEQGSVTLRIEQQPDQRWMFSVTDTGIGIHPEQIPYLFAPFRQTESGREAGGTGLGLAISHRIVDAMGGSLQVESQLDRGSRFWFCLPLVLADVTHLNKQQQDTFSSATLRHVSRDSHLQILVVDDQKTNRNVLCEMLEKTGIEVFTASSGEEAIALWEQHDIPMIFMDLRMPGMSGFEAVRQIRSRHSSPQPWIIAVSAAITSPEQNKAIQAGCQGFVGKPLRWTEVMQTIEVFFPGAFAPSEATSATQQAEISQVVEKDVPQIKESKSSDAILAQQQDTIRLLRQALNVGNFPQMLSVLSNSNVMAYFPHHKEMLQQAMQAYDFGATKKILDELSELIAVPDTELQATGGRCTS